MLRRPKTWLAGTAVMVVVGLCVAIPAALDNTGWLPHERDTDMYFGAASWSAGAYRDCVALPVQDGSMLFLGCVDGAENYLTPEPTRVTFWGKIKRPDRYQAAMSNLSAWKWRCLKKKDSVTCWAVN
jgi:hypothetical protein